MAARRAVTLLWVVMQQHNRRTVFGEAARRIDNAAHVLAFVLPQPGKRHCQCVNEDQHRMMLGYQRSQFVDLRRIEQAADAFYQRKTWRVAVRKFQAVDTLPHAMWILGRDVKDATSTRAPAEHVAAACHCVADVWS